MKLWFALGGVLLCCASCGPRVAPAPTAMRAAPVVVDYAAAGAIEPVVGDQELRPFYPGDYDPAIATPESLLGHPLGAQPAPAEAIFAAFRRWSQQSPRITVARYATSYEGRELVRVVITSERNMARLETILGDVGRLADPRGLSAAEAERIIADTPAIAWLGFSIHGDETSGSDAALALGYHLVASQDPAAAQLLEQVVIVIDPVLNPDGRARALRTLSEMQSLRPSENHMSLHRWRWPGGRGNHYLFDLNRDWLFGVHPETRGRWQVLSQLNPQLIVDAHEMGATDTYLFSPESRPLHPSVPSWLGKWYTAFSRDLARAFDQRGWAYYTREWDDGWYPGYTTSWGQMLGAITFLYEQSSTSGLPLKRPSGARVTYRQSVRGHAVSSWVNLQTLSANREAVLRDYLADKRAAVDARTHKRAFVVVPGRNPDRERALLEILLRSGIEVFRASGPLAVTNAVSVVGEVDKRKSLPTGCWVVPTAQPRSRLVQALLELDPRFQKADLIAERTELERNGRSRIYDVTAWSLGHLFDVDGYWSDQPRSGLEQITELPERVSGVVSGSGTAYGWVVDGRLDGSVVFAARALELGLQVHVSDKPFERAGMKFVRGSVLVLRAENPKDVSERVTAAAEFSQVPAMAVATGRAAGEDPDLGGQHFGRLEPPRVGILASQPVAAGSFGYLWFHLDQRLKVPLTMLDLQSLGAHDLRRYNVIIAADAGDNVGAALAANSRTLRAWLQQGGTLIAIGGSAHAVADAKLGLSQVRRRRDVLEALALYEVAAQRSIAARTIAIDEQAVWDGPVAPAGDSKGNGAEAAAEKAAKKAAGGGSPEQGTGKTVPKLPSPAEQKDAWERRFSPQGVVASALVDRAHWLTSGVEADKMPVLVSGSTAYLAPDSVRVAVRLGSSAGLRLAGLLWPEARARLATTAYATVERVGAGQVILFATDPVFRGATRAAARLLSNAVIYGPGLGTSQPAVW